MMGKKCKNNKKIFFFCKLQTQKDGQRLKFWKIQQNVPNENRKMLLLNEERCINDARPVSLDTTRTNTDDDADTILKIKIFEVKIFVTGLVFLWYFNCSETADTSEENCFNCVLVKNPRTWKSFLFSKSHVDTKTLSGFLWKIYLQDMF